MFTGITPAALWGVASAFGGLTIMGGIVLAPAGLRLFKRGVRFVFGKL